MIIDYTEIIDNFKKEIRTEASKKNRVSDWVYNVTTDNKIFLVKPKYRIEVFEYAKALKCAVHLTVDRNTYALDSKGEFRKII